jgi:hypothetical protein
MSGSNTGDAAGVYGTLGIASANNMPGARSGSVSWVDDNGNLWLFGGSNFNDLWEFNPSSKTWTWVGGNNTASVYGKTFTPGVYGTLGVASASNIPGPRGGAVSWTDSSGNFWLFGGEGPTSSTSGDGVFNDLWEFNPSTKEWTWVSGSNTAGAKGVYGTNGVASATNVPGGRGIAVGWADSSGNLWLFGGYGFDSTGTGGELNDLWEFNLSTRLWTWVGGSKTINALGVYGGAQGVASTSNVPGARHFSVRWTDRNGNFWLYGGRGYGATNNGFDLSDLWEFNPATKQWT